MVFFTTNDLQDEDDLSLIRSVTMDSCPLDVYCQPKLVEQVYWSNNAGAIALSRLAYP
jgi:hypothetical protein